MSNSNIGFNQPFGFFSDCPDLAFSRQEKKKRETAVEFSGPAGNEACLLKLNILAVPKDPLSITLLLHSYKNTLEKGQTQK